MRSGLGSRGAVGRGTVRHSAAVLGAAAAVLVLGACDMLEERFEEDSTVREAITQVRIEGGSGSVTIRTGSSPTTSIHTTVRYRGERPTGATYRVDAGSLVLSANDCGRNCSVDYRITVPEGAAVTGRIGSGDIDLSRVASADVESGSGTISIEDVAGPVTAQAGSGDINARGIDGAVTVHTGSGTITLSQITGTVKADASSGDVNARMIDGTVEAGTGSGTIDVQLDTPASVHADAGSGDIVLTVPEGRYHVTATASSGDRNVSVADDPAAPNTLDVHTGSGTITVQSG